LSEKIRKNESDKMCNETKEHQATRDEGEANGVTVNGKNGTIHALVIAGHIEGHYSSSPQTKVTKYEQLIPTLVAVEESAEIGGLLVLLNTVGGDVEAGLALAELIASMRKPTVSVVLGGGHSIGLPLAVSAKTSFAVPSATMMLHPVRVNGLVIGVPQTYNYFDKMQERIIDFITAHSTISAKRLREMIRSTNELTTDVGTILTGNEAVECGLIDRIGGLSDAIDCLRSMM